MTPQAKLALISDFENATIPLLAILRGLAPAVMDFRPNLPNAWSIRDHAIHFLDADTFAYCRIRLCVTQPGSDVLVWDEEQWQAQARYDTSDPVLALETCQALRKVVSGTLRALVPSDWESYWVRHTQRGKVTLAEWLKTYTDHAEFHLGYFNRNLAAAKSAGL